MEIPAYFWMHDDPAFRDKWTERRLRDARGMLIDTLKRGFGRGKFCRDTRTLTGDNGVILQWRSRPQPTQPVSYENQQTSIGVVRLLQHWPIS